MPSDNALVETAQIADGTTVPPPKPPVNGVAGDHSPEPAPDPMRLTQREQVGVVKAQSDIMLAKATLCDRQHELMTAQAAVEQAQKNLAMADERYKGALLQMGYARGLTKGSVNLSADGTRLEV
jgi:hypothetical protein